MITINDDGDIIESKLITDLKVKKIMGLTLDFLSCSFYLNPFM